MIYYGLNILSPGKIFLPCYHDYLFHYFRQQEPLKSQETMGIALMGNTLVFRQELQPVQHYLEHTSR